VITSQPPLALEDERLFFFPGMSYDYRQTVINIVYRCGGLALDCRASVVKSFPVS
jgi:hypothetical protein